MPQFRIPPGSSVGAAVTLSPEDSRHLARVLRGRAGEWVFLYDGENRFESELVSVSPKRVTARIARILPKAMLKGELFLCQSVLKKDAMESVIQKSAELGIADLFPFRSERSVATGINKHERWQKLADEAAKQCGRAKPLVVHSVLKMRPLLAELEGIPKILFWESQKVGESFVKDMTPAARVALIVGPEGGFSEGEVALARERGCAIASLGPLILRAETAAIAAVTLVQHQLGNL